MSWQQHQGGKEKEAEGESREGKNHAVCFCCSRPPLVGRSVSPNTISIIRRKGGVRRLKGTNGEEEEEGRKGVW